MKIKYNKTFYKTFYKTYYKTLPVLLIAAVLGAVLSFTACGGSDAVGPAAVTVKKETFEIVIPAFGELDAVKSTPIQVPPRLRRRQTLAWMAEENAVVKKGETVIRFDSTSYKDKIQSESFNVSKLDLEIKQKKKQLEKEKNDLSGELDVLNIETRLAEIYSARDRTVFARNKIIEDQLDLGYLKEKSKHFGVKKTQLEKKSLAELQLLQLKKQTCQVKLKQYRDALDSLEVKAPHDGIFIYQRNWRGEKPRVGMSAWPGRKIGKLPDLKEMEAKINILESEAAGLKKDLPVTIILDSAPGKEFKGKVTTIDTIAKSLERGSPLKYFKVKVSLEKTDPLFMRPGNQVKAFIYVQRQDNVISVPNQALFFEQGNAFINIKNKSSIEKRPVKTGTRSLTRTVITEGLKEGETILLSKPQTEDTEA